MNVLSFVNAFGDENNIVSVDSFVQAENFLKQHTTDIVLLDADAEQVNWLFVYRKIRTIDKEVKVVLMSTVKDFAVSAFEAGIWDYLIKPVKLEQLKRVLRKK